MKIPVCIVCGLTMKCVKLATIAIEYYDEKKTEPHKAWMASAYECPRCGINIFGGFGEEPLATYRDKEKMKLFLNNPHVGFY